MATRKCYAGAVAALLLELSSVTARNAGAAPANLPASAPVARSGLDAVAARVAALERRLTALETRVTNDEAAVQPYSADAGSNGVSTSADARLASLEARVRALESAGGKSAKSGKIGTRVTAPFEVVDSHGTVIMDVEGNDFTGPNLGFGVRIAGLNGQSIALGATPSGLTGLLVYGNDSAAVPTVGIGIRADRTGIVGVGRAGKAWAASLHSTASGEGEAEFSNAHGTVVASIGVLPAAGTGHAVFSGAGGNWLLKVGARGTRGDMVLRGDQHAFVLWDALVLGLVK
jgi:BMFP domain-containing protein YqiC